MYRTPCPGRWDNKNILKDTITWEYWWIFRKLQNVQQYIAHRYFPLLFTLLNLLFRKCRLSHCWDRVLFSVCDWTLQVKGSNIYVLGHFASLLPHSLMEKKNYGKLHRFKQNIQETCSFENYNNSDCNKNKSISLSSRSESSLPQSQFMQIILLKLVVKVFFAHQSQIPTVSIKVFGWDFDSFTKWFTEMKVVKIPW